jgi:nitroreductase
MAKDPSFIPYHFPRIAPEEMIKQGENFYNFMKTRRTVREFSPEPIPDGIIEQAILTAGTAPSGAHKQPWFFAIVKNQEIKSKIRLAAENEEKINYTSRFPDEWLADLVIFGTNEVKEYIDVAPALIVVFKQNYRLIDGQKYKNYYVNESVGIAIGILITALHQIGLATLTHTPSPMGFLNEILERPKNETPVVLMPVGYPKTGTLVPNIERKPLSEIIKVY